MKTVHVNASKEYDVCIGQGLLPRLGEFAAKLGNANTACIVSDDTVYGLYGETARISLENSGFRCIRFIFPQGEAQKNGNTFLALLSFLAQNRLTRSDLIVALGGGVVGDLAGFAAATYLRGIRFMQVPTTLLAAVDSSVGGKTAIDLPEGKNLAGAFCQPSFVLCDTDCLDSLPLEIFRDGCAEVIKYGILYDAELFAALVDSGLDFDRETVIARCVSLKRDVVAEDEFDTGARMKLNLGHTFGHAVESLSNFSVSHGRAVAIGMAMAARAGAAYGHCNENTRHQILEILERFGLPTGCEFSAEALSDAAFSDKKRSGGTVNLILPNSIGHCAIVPTKVEELKSIFQAGL